MTRGSAFRAPPFRRLASKPCYSAGDLRILVAEAAERSIRVVPELDMPGHVTSWAVRPSRMGAAPRSCAAHQEVRAASSRAEPRPMRRFMRPSTFC